MTVMLMNAAGWAKTVEHVRQLAQVGAITHIVVGSFTVLAREGNMGGTNFYVAPDGTSVNSLGLPNGGVPYLRQHGAEMVRIAHEAGKKIVLSVAGFTATEYATIALVGIECGFDCIEVNAGCPNVVDGGVQKAIASYDLKYMRKILECLDDVRTRRPLWLKVSPYANPLDRVALARLIEEKGTFGLTLVTSNTFPNVSLYHPDGRPALDVANNYGGMAGTALKPISVSNVRHFHDLLPKLDIIGVGGISPGADVMDYRRVGATGFQVGTAFFGGENPRIFEEILLGLQEDALV